MLLLRYPQGTRSSDHQVPQFSAGQKGFPEGRKSEQRLMDEKDSARQGKGAKVFAERGQMYKGMGMPMREGLQRPPGAQ